MYVHLDQDFPVIICKPEVCFVQQPVLSLSQELGYSAHDVLHGDELHIGAQKTVIGLQHAHAYCQDIGIHLKLSPSNATSVFGDYAHSSLGRMQILVPIASGSK